MRTDSARFFELPDGTVHIVQVYPGPVNYLDEDGSFRRIDNKFKTTGDGYRHDSGKMRLDLPTRLRSGDPVRVGFGPGTMSFLPQGTAASRVEVDGSTATYRNVKPFTDLEYDISANGFHERVVLRSRSAQTRIVYDIELDGLTLEREDDFIAVLRGGDQVALIPAFYAEDSSEGDWGEGSTYDLDVSLRQVSQGMHRLSVELDRTWFEHPSRVFPVKIDPTVFTGADVPMLKDTSVSKNQPNQTFYSQPSLRVGRSANGNETMAFATFDIRKAIRKHGDSLGVKDDLKVVDAHLHLYNEQAASQTESLEQRVELHRITESWIQTQVTWNNRPQVDGSKLWSRVDHCSQESPCPGWHLFNVKDLLQWWLDNPGEFDPETNPEGEGSNHGIRLSGPGSLPNNKVYTSMEGAEARHPVVVALVNAPPEAPRFADGSPPDGAVIETDSPAIKIKQVRDADGDDVSVRFQFASDQSFTDVVHDSGWIAEQDTYLVPSGYLEDGTRYYYRVRSTDAYGGSSGQPKTSEVRSLRTVFSTTGVDHRWAMWSTTLGNDVNLRVNRANGNLSLGYLLDSPATQAGPLRVALNYNSHAAQEGEQNGLSPGWQIAAGARDGALQVPIRLEEISFGGVLYGVRLIYESGRKEVYASIGDGKVFARIGPLAGTVLRESSSAGITRGWNFTSGTGGTYKFDAAGHLTTARASSSHPGRAGFDYSLDAAGRILWVQDPASRRIEFTWSSDRLVAVRGSSLAGHRWESLWGGRAFTFNYDTSGRLAEIVEPFADGRKLRFGYDDQGLLATVRDAESESTGGDITQVDYSQGSPRSRVTQVLPAGLSEPWIFSYEGGGTSGTVARSVVTSPRGSATADPNDHTEIVDFDLQGLPIRTTGPYNDDSDGEGTGVWPVTVQQWDDNGNLVCKQDPLQASLTGEEGCSPGTSEFQTDYEYQRKAPHFLTRVTSAAPRAGAPRHTTRHTYENGSGLQSHFFSNVNLIGLPSGLGISGPIDYSWGPGEGPAELDGRAQNFSIRFFGELNASHQGEEPGDYAFRVTAADGVRLVVDGSLLLDCFGVNRSTPVVNCGGTAPVKSLAPGWRDVIVEFQQLSGAKSIKLEWRGPSDPFFRVIPVSALRPRLNLLSGERSGIESDPTRFIETVYRYGFSDPQSFGRDIMRGLPWRISVEGKDMAASELTDLTYDDYGRVLTETDAKGAMITRVHGDSGDQVACEVETDDAVGLVTTRSCNGSGDVVTESVHLASGVSTATTGYDALGRVISFIRPGGGTETTTYDRAGRVVSHVASVGPSLPTRDTTFIYDERGFLHREILPDPDGAGPAPRPEITHHYDDVGNEIVTVDERGQEWHVTHDQASRIATRTDPVSAETAFAYDLAGNLVYERGPHASPGVLLAPVTSTRGYDALSRLTTERLGSLDPSEFRYDPRGLPTELRDPDGVITESDYDALGRIVRERSRTGAGGAVAERTYRYDRSGFLTSSSDFEGRTTTYDRDPMGRLVKVAQPFSGSNEARYERYADGALKTVEVDTAPGRPPLAWAFTYNEDGRLESETDGIGITTTHHYNDVGELIRTEDPRGLSLRRVYDGLGREIERFAQDSSGQRRDEASFSYDASGNLIRAENENAEVTVAYDAASRPVAVEAPGGDTTYAYSGDMVASLTTPAGVTTMTYEPGTGRPLYLHGPFGDEPTIYSFTPGGRLRTRRDPNGLLHEFSHDSAGREVGEVVTDPENNEVASFQSSYDRASRITSRTRELTGGLDEGTWHYHHDGPRLTRADAPDGSSYTYVFDGAGNRTGATHTDSVGITQSSSFSFDRSSRILSRVEERAGIITENESFIHDASGNLTSRRGLLGGAAYSYDSWGELTSVKELIPLAPGTYTEAPIHTRYRVDALSRTSATELVISSPVGDEVITRELFSYEGTSEDLSALSTSDATGTITVETLFGRGPGGYLAQAVTTTTSPPLGDPPTELTTYLGLSPHTDVVYHTSEEGLLTSQKSYEPYGAVRTEAGLPSRLGFQGDHTDPLSGLIDMGARHYDPTLGRFLTRDPLRGEPSVPVSLNPYVYGATDPITNIDPDGECPRPDVCGPTSKSAKGRARQIELGRASVRATAAAAAATARAAIWTGQMSDLFGDYNVPPGCSPPPPGTPTIAVADRYARCKGSAINPVPVGPLFAAEFMGPCYGNSGNPECRVDVRLMVEVALWTFPTGRVISLGSRAAGTVARKLASKAGGGATRGVSAVSRAAATGQQHHVISRRIAAALSDHPTLAGQFAARDPRFVTRALDAGSHRGYQTWHRQLDAEVVDWLARNPNATTTGFESFLQQRYAQPDLLARFPHGF